MYIEKASAYQKPKYQASHPLPCILTAHSVRHPCLSHFLNSTTWTGSVSTDHWGYLGLGLGGMGTGMPLGLLLEPQLQVVAAVSPKHISIINPATTTTALPQKMMFSPHQ
jgi:hypothetical protein